MKDLAYRPNVPVGSLPTPTTALAGVVVRLTTDNKPYWCDGTQWVDLTAAGGGGTTTNALTIGTGLSGSPSSTFNGSAAVTVSVAFGTTASTACVGNDSRLSDARTPTSHTHGNITNAGAIGTTSGLPIITTTSGVLTTGSFGTTAGTFCQGNDGRLSDTRNTTNSCVLKFDTGTTEGTDLYTFNGSAAKTIDIKAGTNVTITKAAGSITIAASGGGSSQWTSTANGIQYSAGNVGIGATAPTVETGLLLSDDITGATTAYGVRFIGAVQSAVTTRANMYQSTLNIAAGTTLTTAAQFEATTGTLTGTVQNHAGFMATSISGGVSGNYGFYSNVTEAAGNHNFFAASTALNRFAGKSNFLRGIQLSIPDVAQTADVDTVHLYGKLYGGSGSRVMAAAVGPSGMDYTLQPALWRQKIARWNAPGNATTVPGVDGFNAPTAVGTATARNVAVTNALTRAKRLGYVSATTAGSLTGHYNTVAQYTLGTGTNLGGFFYSCRFGISDATLQAVGRTFVGLTSSVAAFTNVEPSTLTNCIGVGNTASGTTLRIFYAGSAAQAPIDLGANFPVSNTDFYDVTFWSPPNQNGVVYYYVERIGTTFIATGQLGPGTAGTTLPANTTLLAHRAWRTNNTAAAAVGIDISNVYIETDW